MLSDEEKMKANSNTTLDIAILNKLKPNNKILISTTLKTKQKEKLRKEKTESKKLRCCIAGMVVVWLLCCCSVSGVGHNKDRKVETYRRRRGKGKR